MSRGYFGIQEGELLLSGNSPKIGSVRVRVKKAVSFSKNFLKTLKLVWQVSPLFTFLTGFTLILGSLIPAAQTWIGKLIIDRVVSFIGLQVAFSIARPIFILVIIALVLSLIGELLRNAQEFFQELLTDLTLNHVNLLILQKTSRLDLSYFEDSEFHDKIEKIRRESNFRPIRLLYETFRFFETTITGASMFLLLAKFGPIILGVLIVASLPEFFFNIAYSYKKYHITDSRVPESRKVWYWSRLLSSDRTVKEVKLFSLAKYLLGKYTGLFRKFYQQNKGLALQKSVGDIILGSVSAFTFYASYAFVIWRAMLGFFTLGDLTLYHRAFQSAMQQLSYSLSNLSRIYEHNLYLADLFEFLALKSRIIDVQRPKRMPHLLKEGIEFRDVSFKYPDAKRYALKDINFLLHPNESISLVGRNGAGKTTLVKLLTRLYEPTSGEILIDGVDYREIKLSELRRAMGVIFQDFVAYQAKARENIGYGDLAKLNKLPEIIKAAQESGAHGIIKDLPEGYETLLGKQFEGGHELSWGEWQKIALARGFFRDAQILILDEPTASLDAEAEYALYKKFARLAQDKIVILISHRFSTVRVAKKIYVLDKGKITEQGTHQELRKLGGEYAQLFTMQAEGYR